MGNAIVLIILMGILLAAYEKLLNHRKEVLEIRARATSDVDAELVARIQALQAEVDSLRVRLDEQVILVDDLQRLLPPSTGQDIRQRLGGA